jgi:hypothetical protein
MLVSAGKLCPSSLPVRFPYFITNGTEPDACSCSLTYLYAAFLDAPVEGLKCTQEATSLDSLQTCNCCAASEIVSMCVPHPNHHANAAETDGEEKRYYNGCNTTSLDQISLLGALPFGTFAGCLGTLAATNCSDPAYGFLPLPDAYWKHALQPNGTQPTTNGGGSVTSPPYGASTVWTFPYGGGSAFTFTATAAAYPGGGAKGGAAGGATGTAGGAQATGGASKAGAAGRMAVAPGAVALGALAAVAAAAAW